MKKQAGDLKAYLGEDSAFQGTLNFSGVVRIDGKFEGKVITNDTLIVGETGQLIAECMDDWLDHIIKIAKELFIEENKFDIMLEEQFLAITNYCRGLSYNILAKDRMDTNPEFVFNYDIGKWLNNTTTLPLSDFKIASSKIMFCLTHQLYQLVQETIAMYGNIILSWIKPR